MRYVTPLTRIIPRLTVRAIVTQHTRLLYRDGHDKVSAKDFARRACSRTNDRDGDGAWRAGRRQGPPARLTPRSAGRSRWSGLVFGAGTNVGRSASLASWGPPIKQSYRMRLAT